MSQICLYLDEDTIKSALVKALRNADLDVMTVADIGMLGYSDEEQLIWSTEHKKVIYSFNIGDFCRLHRASRLYGSKKNSWRNHSCTATAIFNRSTGDRITQVSSHYICRRYDRAIDIFEFLFEKLVF